MNSSLNVDNSFVLGPKLAMKSIRFEGKQLWHVNDNILDANFGPRVIKIRKFY